MKIDWQFPFIKNVWANGFVCPFVAVAVVGKRKHCESSRRWSTSGYDQEKNGSRSVSSKKQVHRGSLLYIYRLLSQLLYFPTWKLSRFASFVTNNSSRLLGGEQLNGVIISRLYLKKKYVSTCLEKEIVKWKLPDKRIISIYFEETSDLRERNLWFMID